MNNIVWPSRIDALKVTSLGGAIGRLGHDSRYIFTYDPSAERAAALNMPIRLESYGRESLHPAFEMNLPEGFLRKYISGRLVRHTKINDMLFLALQGNRGIGHLGFEGGLELPDAEPMPIADLLSHTKSDGLFEYLLEKYGLTHSLSGMQPKILVATDRATLQYPNCIVKSSDNEFPDLAVNEFVCMQLADKCGLPVPRHYLSDNKELFVIERFDLAGGQKLGFEDFCSLLGKSGNDRYLGSYENAANILNVYSARQSDSELFFRYIVFSALVGNGDAHLKNFGLLYNFESNSVPSLAPVYDVTCTLYYPRLDRSMALKMNNDSRFPSRRELIKFGRNLRLLHPERIIDELGQLVLDSLETIAILEEYPVLKDIIQRQTKTTLVASTTGFKVNLKERTRKKKH